MQGVNVASVVLYKSWEVISWRRGESNSRPKRKADQPLHVYSEL